MATDSETVDSVLIDDHNAFYNIDITNAVYKTTKKAKNIKDSRDKDASAT